MGFLFAVYTRNGAQDVWKLYSTPPTEQFACDLAGALVRLKGDGYEAMVLRFENADAAPETVGADEIRNAVRWTSDPDFTMEEKERFERLEREFQEEERARKRALE